MSSNPYSAPISTPPAARGWTANDIKNALIAAATTLAIAVAVVLSLDPSKYFRYQHEDPNAWTHPTLMVAVFCGMFIAEGAFVAATLRLRPGARIWLRSLIAFVLFLPWTGLSTMIVMHAPVFVMFHTIWTWILLAALGLTFLCSAARALLRPRGIP